MASSFDGPVALVTDMPIRAVHHKTGAVTASARQSSGAAPSKTTV
jgi:hypothetical protein